MKARMPAGYNKGFNNMQQLAAQATKMQEQMEEASKKIDEKEFMASSPEEKIKVTVMGSLEVKKVEIDESLLEQKDSEMIEDYLIIALNEAIKIAKDEKEQVMNAISGGLNIPGM